MPYRQPDSLTGKPFVVLGAGTLGRRIAATWLTQGEIVHLFDPNPKALDDAAKYVSDHLQDIINRHVENGKPGTLKTFHDRSEALKNAWIVVEVVPEILQLKIDLLGELDAILPDDCILASNSSSYTGSEMFEKVKNRERLVNTHYYLGSLPVEIMPNPHTDPAVVDLLLHEAPRHGLRTYHVRKECVGLLFNRIWAAIKREALCVVAEGVSSPAEVDSIMKDVLGVRRGVFELLDAVGLDVALDIENHYARVRGAQVPPEPAVLLQSMVDRGELGVKTGKGFYAHPGYAPTGTPGLSKY